jgi:hypothetical protein
MLAGLMSACTLIQVRINDRSLRMSIRDLRMRSVDYAFRFDWEGVDFLQAIYKTEQVLPEVFELRRQSETLCILEKIAKIVFSQLK